MEQTSINRKENELRWRSIVSRAESRPGSMTDFCKSEGIGLPAFNYWKRRFGSKKNQVVTSVAKQNEVRPQAFLPVEILRSNEAIQSGLPDPKWVAEILFHLNEAGRRGRQ